MTIQDWGAIGEIVGAGGVILSLIYLATQIKNQNRESQLNTVNESAKQWNDVLASTAQDRELSELWISGLNDFSALDSTSRAQFSAHAGRVLRVIEGLHLHHKKGGLDAEGWEAINSTLKDFCGYQGLQDWWETRSHFYRKSFQQYVNGLIRQVDVGSRLYDERPK